MKVSFPGQSRYQPDKRILNLSGSWVLMRWQFAHKTWHLFISSFNFSMLPVCIFAMSQTFVLGSRWSKSSATACSAYPQHAHPLFNFSWWMIATFLCCIFLAACLQLISLLAQASGLSQFIWKVPSLLIRDLRRYAKKILPSRPTSPYFQGFPVAGFILSISNPNEDFLF